MHGLLRASLLCLALISSTAFPAASQQSALMQPLGAPGRYTFAPNQLAAAEWYKPAGRLINGHIEESFVNEKNWPEVRRFLQATNGAFGINAAEIGYLSSDWLLKLRQSGIRLSVETPAWTQCASGVELAQAEIFGSPIAGRNIFQSTFQIVDTGGRSDPVRHGWFFTKDGKDYAPDEIVLDHRIALLIPNFDNDVLLAVKPGLSWQTRKDAARRDPCPSADGFHQPSVDRVTGGMLDYVDYVRVLAQKYPVMPAFSFHWNVNAGWEWRDVQCLDALHELSPDEASFDKAFRYVDKPCHSDTAMLDRLVDMLCRAGTCPATVFMDVGLTYQTGYVLDVLRRNRDVLRKHGVAFGVDLDDECSERMDCVQFVSAPGVMGLKQVAANDVQSENMLDQEGLLNRFSFLVDNGIIDRDTHVRFEAWSVRPVESGDETAESKKGSFANTVLLLARKFIMKRGWARE